MLFETGRLWTVLSSWILGLLFLIPNGSVLHGGMHLDWDD